MIRFGVHCSLRKGLSGVLDEAQRLGCEAVQIFTRSPRMWKMTSPSFEDIESFVHRRRSAAIFPLIVHSPYLPNLASSQARLYRISVESLTEDLRICQRLCADYLVVHPGSYSLESTVLQGITNIARGVNRALRASGNTATRVLLENVSGGGRRLGSSFEEMARMLDLVNHGERVGICLDTAHALGAGYDLSTPKGIEVALKELEKCIGIKNLFAMHLNDSKAPRGSHRDRHQHLGKGFIGARGFKYLIKRLTRVVSVGILETPKDSSAADKHNLSLLFKWRDEN